MPRALGGAWVFFQAGGGCGTSSSALCPHFLYHLSFQSLYLSHSHEIDELLKHVAKDHQIDLQPLAQLDELAKLLSLLLFRLLRHYYKNTDENKGKEKMKNFTNCSF